MRVALSRTLTLQAVLSMKNLQRTIPQKSDQKLDQEKGEFKIWKCNFRYCFQPKMNLDHIHHLADNLVDKIICNV